MRLYYTLADYPHATVDIDCPKYGRNGRLLSLHQPDLVQGHASIEATDVP
jgi:hypothetical protein